VFYPKYISIAGHSHCVLEEETENYAVYYRDAGHWGIQVWWNGGKLVGKGIKFPRETFFPCVQECTKEEWKASNAGYL
jgi:hypothetical protein